MNSIQAVEKLNKQIELIEDEKNRKLLARIQKWYRDTEILIEKVFGKD